MELQAMDFITALRTKIRMDMNNFTDDMANGQCKDFAQYQELCGVIRGLAFAERHLLDLAEKLKEDDDE